MTYQSWDVVYDDLDVLLNMLPNDLAAVLKDHSQRDFLIEIVLDLGGIPEVRFSDTVYRVEEFGEITEQDLKGVVKKVGMFNDDNRAGIGRTLHRISAMRSRSGDIIGLTCRVGRAVYGTIDIIKDIIESGHNCLFLGPPGIGKTTILRETARVLSDVSQKRVIVVDTSNEIAGDGDIPHPGIGYARRMQVPRTHLQHAVMIEAVENHMPEVIIVDEIGTQEETVAARTIAERGVQLVATAHGYDLESLIKNPILSELLGGVQNVVLGDEEAKFRGTQKTVLERKSLPTFDVVIEIRSRTHFVIYKPVTHFVDGYLRSDPMEPEHRKLKTEGAQKEEDAQQKPLKPLFDEAPKRTPDQVVGIFPYGINHGKLGTIIQTLQVPVELTKSVGDADFVLTTRPQVKSKSKMKHLLQDHKVPVHILDKNTDSAMIRFFRSYFKLSASIDDVESEAIRELKLSCKKVIQESRVMEVSPQPGYIRKLQHKVAFESGLNSMSVGEEPNRRVRVYPRTGT